MADPATMMLVFAGASAVSSSLSAYGQYESGQAAKKAGEAEQAAYYYNADVTLEQMKEHAQTSEAHYVNLMGRQRSLYAKAGVDITSGSPLLILADTAAQASEETARIQYGSETEATLQRYYGDMAAYRGRVGAQAADVSAMTTFLTGLGKSGMTYMAANKGAYPADRGLTQFG